MKEIRSTEKLLKKISYNNSKFNIENAKNVKIYQYTNIKNIDYFMNDKMTLKLNRLDKCNDGQEVSKVQHSLLFDEPKKIYVSCFTRNLNENIHMWYMYGHCKYSKKVRLAFSKYNLYKLINEKKYIIYYKENGKNIRLANSEFSIELTKIAYVSYSSEVDEKNRYDICYIGDNKYRCNYNSVINHKSELAGKVKNAAWKTENEVRVILKLYKEIQTDFLMIEFTDNSPFLKEVVLSPWYDYSEQIKKDVKVRYSLFYSQLDNIFPSTECQKCNWIK